MPPPASRSPWLFGPALDLLFVANLTWPLVAVVVFMNRRWLDLPVELLLTAVIGTPHRWITLPLIANDRERITHRWGTIAAVGAATTAGFLGLWFFTRDLGLLLLIRYLWNIWHVAAQNTGVTRIYEIKARPDLRTSGATEKWLLRGFMVFAFLRVAGVAFAGSPEHAPYLLRFSVAASVLDWPAFLIPLWLFAREARAYDPRLIAKYVHMGVSTSNYAAMLLCAHFKLVEWGVAVSVGNAVFHATEYFSIVTWSVGRSAARPASFFLPEIARAWLKSLALFLVLMAVTSAFLATKYGPYWVLLNTLVSYLHYAWDGVIWKMPAVFPQAKDTDAPSRTQPALRRA